MDVAGLQMCEPNPDPAEELDDLEDALAVLAADDLEVFAQYVLRDEAPGVRALEEGDVWSADDDVLREVGAFGLGDGVVDDGIELQPYHRAYLRTLRTNQHVVCTAHTESGKTQLLIAYILWRLGRNPAIRVAVVSEGARLATAICRTIAKYIADDTFSGCQALRRVFPHLRPGAVWSTESYEVERPPQVKDFSFAPFGAVGGITGARCDIIACDDLVTPRTTATPYIRAQNVDIFDQKIQNRPTARGQIILNCNAQWSDDLSAQLEERGFTPFRMAVTKNGEPDGELEWPARWSRRRIADQMAKNPDWPAMLFARRRQIGEWGTFDRTAILAALHAGAGLTLGRRLALPPGATVCIGVDFAFGEDFSASAATGGVSAKKKVTSDKCAIVTVLREPPRPGDVKGRRTVLNIQAGRWNELDALERLRREAESYPLDRVQIRAESNAGQRWVAASWARQLRATVTPYRTSGKKWDAVSGIPSLAADLLAGLWVLPSDGHGHPVGLVKDLIDQMNAFDPSKAGRDHTGDILMALFFAHGLAGDNVNPDFRYRSVSLRSDGTEIEHEEPEEADEVTAPGKPRPKPVPAAAEPPEPPEVILSEHRPPPARPAPEGWKALLRGRLAR